MKLHSIFLLLVTNLFSALCQNNDVFSEWQNFKVKYNKIYEDEIEETKRFEIFKNNLISIKSNNELFKKKQSSFEMEVNYFTDLNENEIVMSNLHNLQDSETMSRSLRKYYEKDDTKLPLEIDWRKAGVLSQVKNQGSCGSCWAFSTAGAVEAHMNIYLNKTVNVSVQNLVDCVGNNFGCLGGWLTPSFKYMSQNGVNSEEYYPYKNRSGFCRRVYSKNIATVKSYYSIRQNDEEALKHAVATKGPVSVGIMTERKFFNYNRGIYYSSTCRTGQNSLNHAVLVVGYGTENEVDYWTIKNSWGKEWGDNGYAKLARNRNNHCGIATIASFPVVDLPKNSKTFRTQINDFISRILIFLRLA